MSLFLRWYWKIISLPWPFLEANLTKATFNISLIFPTSCICWTPPWIVGCLCSSPGVLLFCQTQILCIILSSAMYACFSTKIPWDLKIPIDSPVSCSTSFYLWETCYKRANFLHLDWERFQFWLFLKASIIHHIWTSKIYNKTIKFNCLRFWNKWIQCDSMIVPDSKVISRNLQT